MMNDENLKILSNAPLRIRPKGDKKQSCISLHPLQVLIIDWFIMFVNQT